MVLEVNERKLNLLELTVCSNSNHGFEEANKRKLLQQTYMYCQLISDLEAKGIEVVYTKALHCQIPSADGKFEY